jgi:hypothetical protein
MQRKPQLEDENNNLSEIANDSIQSLKSLDDEKFKKINISENKNTKINNLIDIKDKEKNSKLNLKEDINKQSELNIDLNKKENKIEQPLMNEKQIVDEDGLNIPYEERINKMNKDKDNFNNSFNNEEKKDNINIPNPNIENKNEINGNININEIKSQITKDIKAKEINNKTENKIENENNKPNNDVGKYENLPRKIETNQYKKIEISNDNNKYTGCIKKIEISNNLKLNINSPKILENSSTNKDSTEIKLNEINIDTNKNKSLSNRDKSPFRDDLIEGQKKDDLFNSSEFNSNIKDGVIEENDLNNEKVEKNENKDKIDLNEKKSRNNISEIKDDIKEENKNINNINNNIDNSKINKPQIQIPNSDIIDKFEENNYQLGINLNNLTPIQDNNNSGINNINFRYNENQQVNSAKNNKENENKINIKVENVEEKKKKILLKLSNDNIEKLSNDLCEEIISNLLTSEIKDKKKSLFKKKKEINASLNSSASLIVSQNSMSIGSHSPGRNYPSKNNINLVNNQDSYQTISSVNNSQSEAILNNSIFMRTLDEIKKEKTLNLYNDKIAPLLINEIEKNMDKNYENIINNLKVPLRIDEAKMINGLMLKDRSLSISSKIRFCNDDITKVKFVDNKILKEFEKIDKEIRNSDNSINDVFYDKILNKCVYDTTNEIIEKQRKYGIIGEPLPWSIRTKDIDYKYKNFDTYSKSIFMNKIIKEIKKTIDTKMGLIAENYEYLDMDQLNQDRDKKFMESITKELKDNEDYYQIFETQETYVKLSLSRIIMDQLLNEIVEILEHVQYSRKEPDKYQSKSIYACEDIPRLSFQPQTMENNYSGNLEGDGEGDESINQ